MVQINHLLKVPLNKNQYGYCAKDIPRGPLAIVPFDIVIKHKERWQYLNRNRTSKLGPVYLLSSSKTPTTRFYCIRTKYNHSRFPYFSSALLEVDSEVFLTDGHKKVIKEQFNVL